MHLRTCRSIALVPVQSAELLTPPAELSAYRLKPRIVQGGKLGHLHMVGVDPDRDVPGQDSRVFWHDLLDTLIGVRLGAAFHSPGRRQTEAVPRRSK